jgi:hypothetical protein
MKQHAIEISSEFFTDRRLATELTIPQRLFYIGLWSLTEGDGELEDDPQRLLEAILPFHQELSPSWAEDTMQLLERLGLLTRDELDGRRFAILTRREEIR